MLKWAVNSPRASYLQDTQLKPESTACFYCQPKLSSSNPHWTTDKENRFTSTPLHTIKRGVSSSPLRKLASLKDVSNIAPENLNSTPKSVSLNASPNNKQFFANTPKILPANYASTLPTYDVEYSPCGLVPGPLLALRGMGIADTYFKKPRYLNQEVVDASTPSHTAFSSQTAITEELPSLSSSKMGDMTLERMIDAILESNRKEKKLPKHHIALPASLMSPTYTRADDPASDLHEYWDAKSSQYMQRPLFNEREVRSPIIQRLKQDHSLTIVQLRRQRAVRRKRRITKISFCSVKNSAQKLLHVQSAKTYHKLKTQPVQPSSNREQNNNDIANNISPDSGRNSSSELEDSALEFSSGSASSAKGLDVTKRRLSFANSNIYLT